MDVTQVPTSVAGWEFWFLLLAVVLVPLFVGAVLLYFFATWKTRIEDDNADLSRRMAEGFERLAKENTEREQRTQAQSAQITSRLVEVEKDIITMGQRYFSENRVLRRGLQKNVDLLHDHDMRLVGHTHRLDEHDRRIALVEGYEPPLEHKASEEDKE